MLAVLVWGPPVAAESPAPLDEIPGILVLGAWGHAAFVEGTLLAEYIDVPAGLEDLGALRVSPGSAEYLMKQLGEALRESDGMPTVACLRSDMPWFCGLSWSEKSLPAPVQEWFLYAGVTVVGRVESLTHGWSPYWDGGPAVLAQVSVVELLYSQDSRFFDLTELVVLLPGSEVTLEPVTLRYCSGPWPKVAEGDLLLLDLSPPGHNPSSYWEAIDALPIRDGRIENPGFLHVVVPEGTTLAEVSASAAKWRERIARHRRPFP